MNLKIGTGALLILLTLAINGAWAQENLPWLLPPSDGYDFIRKKGNGLLVRRDTQWFLLKENGQLTEMPGAEPQPAGACWVLETAGLKGAWHPDKGWVLPPVYDHISLLMDEVFQVEKYGMKAVVNSRNELLLPYSKGQLKQLDQHFFLKWENQRFRLVDKTGNFAGFEHGRNFKALGGGYYYGYIDKQLLIVDKKGEAVFPKGYEAYLWQDEQYAWVKNGGLWGLINRTGQVVLPFEYQSVKGYGKKPAEAPYLIAKREEEAVWDLIETRTWKTTTVKGYDNITLPGHPDGFATVVKAGKRSCATLPRLREVVTPEEEGTLDCNNCPFRFQSQSGIKLYNEKGKPLHEGYFQSAMVTREGVTLTLQKGQNPVLLNPDGKALFPTTYPTLQYLPTGSFWGVDMQGRSYLLFPDGRQVLLEGVAKILDFRTSNAYFKVAGTNGKVGFISPEGKVLIPYVLDEAEAFLPNLILATCKGTKGLLKMD